MRGERERGRLVGRARARARARGKGREGERERERERASVCVCERERESECVREWVYVLKEQKHALFDVAGSTTNEFITTVSPFARKLPSLFNMGQE